MQTKPALLRSVIGWLGLVVVCVLVHVGAMTAQTGTTQKSSSTKGSTAANAGEENKSEKTEYSQEAVVVERYITRVNYEADGTGTKETLAEFRMIADAGVQRFAVLNFGYTMANETVEFDYVRVRKPDGTVVTTPDYNIQDMPADVTRTAPMYSDLHEKHVAVRALGVGDALEYLVRYRILKPQVPGQFWLEYNFEANLITKDEQLEVTVPKDKYLKVSSPEHAPIIKDAGGKRQYMWKSSFLARQDEKEDKPKRDFPEVQISTFKSWEEVGRLYGDLQQPELASTPALVAKAAQLTKGLTTDEAKIRALYDYVSTQFHYIGLSFGIGRYQPHPADDVLANQYGDCKDKHTLLAALLKAAGYEAWPALVNSSRKVDPEVPSLSQFDHVITVVPRGKSLVWLDTTPQVAPFGLIMGNLRDKQALVVITGKTPELMKTPVDPPFARLETFTAEAKLASDGTLTSTMHQELRGDTEVVLRLVFRQTPRNDWKTFAQNMSYRYGFGGEVSNVETSSLENTAEPFTWTYDYTRKTYSDWENGRITPPFPPIGIEGLYLVEKKPTEPVELGAPGEVVYKAKIQLPLEKDPVLLPTDAHVEAPFATFESKYTMDGRTLVVTRRMTVKVHEVPVSGWEALKKFSKAVSDDREQWINLRGGAATPDASGSGSNAEASAAFRDAVDAIQRRDLTGAIENAEKTIKLDPKFKGVHFLMGFAYASQNRIAAALEQFKKEEELNPDDTRSYEAAARLLRFARRNDEALEQYRKLLKVDPGNRGAARSLSQMLMADSKSPEAIAVLEDAVKRSPDSATLRMDLGMAYVRAGQGEKGAKLLQDSISEDSSPEVLNDVAYVMSDANLQLGKAQEYGERAVQTLEKESQNASEMEGLRLTQSLGNTWDTLGWVYFRQGESAKALAYVEASWLLTQVAEAGDHLGQIYERLGRKKEAAHQYELSAAAMVNEAPGQNPQVKVGIEKRYKQLTGKELNLSPRVQRLPSGGWSMMPGEELSRMRSFKVPTGGTVKSGSATVSLEISPEKITNVRFVKGGEHMEPLRTRLAQLKLNAKFPTGSKALLLRRGMLMCTPTGCDLVLLLPNSMELRVRQQVGDDE